MVRCMDISDRIVQSRRADVEIAKACGVHMSTAGHWRHGRSHPHVKFIRALARCIGSEPEDLIPPEPKRATPA